MLILLAAWLLGTCYARCGERPAFLALRTEQDGPAPSRAGAAIFFLHGYGGSIGDVRWLRKQLRAAGVGDDVSIVLVDGPYSSGLGRSWGDRADQTAVSVERVRALLADQLPEGSLPPARVVIAGFSQGAGIAAEVAAVEPRVGGLASLSSCGFRAREALAKRQDLRSLIAHGSRDSLCSVGQSRALVAELERAGSQVKYVEFDDNHVIPPQVIAALAEWVGAATPSERR
ncbi:MAG: alpha/beta fold hydrolase [Myxococcales bacterium]|nr:alpha/beta fold hydrolase [Myxococcales bacterium]